MKDKTYELVIETIGAVHMFVRINSTMLKMILQRYGITSSESNECEKKIIVAKKMLLVRIPMTARNIEKIKTATRKNIVGVEFYN